MAGNRRAPEAERQGNEPPNGGAHDYVVLGDLGVDETQDGASKPLTRKQIRDGERKYIVRMFLGGIHPGADVFDEEFVAHIEDLHAQVTKRMEAGRPARKALLPVAETDDHLTKTRQHPGHAVPVPGHWISDERDQYERRDFPL